MTQTSKNTPKAVETKPADSKDQQTLFGQLLAFESAVRRREHNEAWQALAPMLTNIENGKWTFGPSHFAHSEAAEVEATRLASALMSMLTDPDYQITRSALHLACRFKRAICQVFEISGYRGTNNLATQFGSFNEDGDHVLTSKDIPKLMLLQSVNALTLDSLRIMERLAPDIRFSLLLGFLSEQLVYSRTAEAMRSRLLAMADEFLDLSCDRHNLQSIGPAYMGCSYAVDANKHDIKRAFNAVMRRSLLEQGASDTKLSKTRTLKERPTILVFAEFYHELHAMHRCYGPSIKALRDRFNTVLFLPKGNDAPAMRELADTLVEFEFSVGNASEFLEKIQSYKPDILYMPSVGMRVSSIAASVMRLAPIQIMTFGHPATTKSDAMDYVVLAEDQLGDPATIDETIVLRPSGKRHAERSDAEPIAPDIRLKPDVVRFAVPAWSRKITPVFLEACRRIVKQSERPVEFWFFPNSVGALQQAFERRYDGMLPGRVLPRTDYNTYVRNINQCDVFLSTFPFGATNGILDASIQGLPIVNMRGPEVHTLNDSHLVEKLDQPAWLTTDDRDAFVSACVRLANDDALRVQISRNILDGDPAKTFLVTGDENPRDMADVFEGIYLLHDDIQARGKKVVTNKELMQALERRRAELRAAQ